MKVLDRGGIEMAKRVRAARAAPVGTFEDRFLAKLKELTAGGEEAVTNNLMRLELRWKPERYEKTKQGLLAKKLIGVATGAGGKVRLIGTAAPVVAARPLKTFVSYSHADEKIRNELIKHLYPLERSGLLTNWYDRKLKAGENFNSIIAAELEASDIIIILVSADFIHSKYCYDIELVRAMQRQTEKTAIVIPVIVRKCLWHETPFGELLAVPEDGRAVSMWPDQDEALTAVAEAIRARAIGLKATLGLAG